MSEEQELNKAVLIERIDNSWPLLQAALNQLSEEQLSSIKDPAGWAVKDHVMHMAAWERGVVFLLQGRPRHEGMWVDEAVYQSGSFETINVAVFERFANLPAKEALAALAQAHQEMMAVLEGLSDADLARPYGDYVPEEAGEEGGAPVINVVLADTADHFAEHLEWIEALAGLDAAAAG